MASRRTPIVILNLIKSFGKSFFDISQINDNLFLSGEYKETDLMNIHKLGIKCVIDMRSETIFDNQKFNDLGIEYHNIPVDNFYPPDDTKTIFGIEIIKKHINSNQKILVHCKEGVGRSPYIIAGYLITQGYSLYESLSLIKSKRWGVNLNKIQRKAIKQFYEKIVFD